jgi:hypothetical protein
VPNRSFVEPFRVECLSCGARRIVVGGPRHGDPGECHRCGYVGWAGSEDLTAKGRRLLREHPMERRRLRIV